MNTQHPLDYPLMREANRLRQLADQIDTLRADLAPRPHTELTIPDREVQVELDAATTPLLDALVVLVSTCGRRAAYDARRLCGFGEADHVEYDLRDTKLRAELIRQLSVEVMT